jgi:hypothetical protein
LQSAHPGSVGSAGKDALRSSRILVGVVMRELQTRRRVRARPRLAPLRARQPSSLVTLATIRRVIDYGVGPRAKINVPRAESIELFQ